MRDIALHVLDIIENAVTAGATRIDVKVKTEKKKEFMILEICDNGCGMNAATKKRALDPFFTQKAGKRVGLGLPLLAQAAREAGGGLSINSIPGKETCVTASFKLNHPDRKPMGDLADTVAMMKAAHPTTKLCLTYDAKEKKHSEVKHEAQT